MITLEHYVTLSLILFLIGAGGVIARRNMFIMLIGIELMLNAVNLMLIAYGRYFGNVDAQAITLLMMAVAAAEISLGLALIICMFKLKQNITVDNFSELKE